MCGTNAPDTRELITRLAPATTSRAHGPSGLEALIHRWAALDKFGTLPDIFGAVAPLVLTPCFPAKAGIQIFSNPANQDEGVRTSQPSRTEPFAESLTPHRQRTKKAWVPAFAGKNGVGG